MHPHVAAQELAAACEDGYETDQTQHWSDDERLQDEGFGDYNFKSRPTPLLRMLGR